MPYWFIPFAILFCGTVGVGGLKQNIGYRKKEGGAHPGKRRMAMDGKNFELALLITLSQNLKIYLKLLTYGLLLNFDYTSDLRWYRPLMKLQGFTSNIFCGSVTWLEVIFFKNHTF